MSDSGIRRGIRWLLFVSSYFPAFLIVSILFIRRDLRIALAALAVGVAGCAALWLVLRHLRSVGPKPLTIQACKPQGTEAMTYVVTYVIPFAFGVLEGPESALAFIVFFFFIGVLYVNSSLIHVNPMLNVFRYQIHQVEVQGGLTVTVISRRHLQPGHEIDAVDAGGGVFLHIV